MDIPWRRVAAAATWTFRGDESRRRRGRDVVAAATRAGPEGGTTKLFVGNVAYEANDSDVNKLFEGVAELRGMRWVTHKDSGEFKGCGYLLFYSPEDADTAMEKLDGAELCGRKIRLDYTQ